MYFSTCGHCVKNGNLANLGGTTRLYEDEEKACPLCKNPNNIAIPIIPGFQTKLSSLEKDATCVEVDTLIELLFSTTTSESVLNSETKNTEVMKEFSKEIEEPINNLKDVTMISTLNYSDLINMVNNRLPPIEASKKQHPDYSVTKLIAESIVYIVDMIKLTGLPHFILKLAPYYHNLFKSLRLMTYDELCNESDKQTYEAMFGEKLTLLKKQIAQILNAEEFIYITFERKVLELLMTLVNFIFILL